MKIENSDSELRELARRVFSIVEWVTGNAPIFQEGSGWYKCGEPIFVWFYLVGQKAKKNPANSILVAATKSKGKLIDASQKIGNNMFGNKTPEFVVRSGDAENFSDFLEFIGRAYKAMYVA